MKTKIIIVSILLMISANCFAFGPEYIGIPTDKYMHTVTSYALTGWLKNECKLDWWQTFLIINALGITKEVLDDEIDSGYDPKDLMANAAGWLLVYTTIEL